MFNKLAVLGFGLAALAFALSLIHISSSAGRKENSAKPGATAVTPRMPVCRNSSGDVPKPWQRLPLRFCEARPIW